jgi:hypothetical protein
VFNAWLALTFQTAQLGLDAQHVVALRLMRLSGGGAVGATEARRMVADKMAALTEAQFAAAAAVLTGDSLKLVNKLLRVFKKRVRANRNRLANRRRAR